MDKIGRQGARSKPTDCVRLKMNVYFHPIWIRGRNILLISRIDGKVRKRLEKPWPPIPSAQWNLQRHKRCNPCSTALPLTYLRITINTLNFPLSFHVFLQIYCPRSIGSSRPARPTSFPSRICRAFHEIFAIKRTNDLTPGHVFLINTYFMQFTRIILMEVFIVIPMNPRFPILRVRNLPLSKRKHSFT